MNIPKNNKQLIPLITEAIYHSLDNRYLSNSRMGDWLKCKNYFKERHITGERPNGPATDALEEGSALDTYIFHGEEVFNDKFRVVARRNVKNPPISYTELTQLQYDNCILRAKVLSKQQAIIDLKGHTTQEIITLDMDLGNHFCGVCAMPDWWTIEGDTCIITDLKTSMEMNEAKYHWHCVNFKYYRQVALMRLIIEVNHPEVKHFVYRHVGIWKDKEGIGIPFAFYLAEEQVNAYYDDIKRNILPDIKAEIEFLPKSVDWDSAPTVGEARDEY